MVNSLTFVLYLCSLATLGSATFPANPKCSPLPASCSRVPASESKACASIITKSKLQKTTCEVPSSTVTKTVTLTPQPKTIKITRTDLRTADRTSQHTAYSTAVITSIVSSHTDILVTATVHETATTTSTSTTTTTVGLPGQCIVPRNIHLERKEAIPSCCKCFLTTTKSCGVATTTTITKAAPTPVITQTVVVYATLYKTVIEETTKVSTYVNPVTSVDVGTITTSVTVIDTTQTATTVSTATATYDPCANPFTLGINQKASSPNAVLGMESDGRNVNDCCTKCNMNQNCVIYSFDPAQNLCSVYFARTQGEGCSTAQCPFGRQGGDLLRGDGRIYGFGPCAGGFVA
ncbi:hypothetical protein BCR34DRAFT_200039 [Clohesyomyces aquaticus]|uniref:Apple domain-containing protein n=1 Tax=Clohesyomyces aquaticus TaxID=1231657 RepID=A0A1Y1YB95_9PLEO|nr:hypothetical protein BCR34DRAFT_200039 [Clohesyomyces aquaticus]